MAITLLTDHVWQTLTAATKTRVRPAVAVAYFGQGAAKLLPLPNGSRIVVDASEGAVKSGQTCPAELIKLLKRGVRIYSRKNLHAKIFVFGSKVFVGSANVSLHSAHTLREAMLVTTDRNAIATAREFIRELCFKRLALRHCRVLRSFIGPHGCRAAVDNDQKQGKQIQTICRACDWHSCT